MIDGGRTTVTHSTLLHFHLLSPPRHWRDVGNVMTQLRNPFVLAWSVVALFARSARVTELAARVAMVAIFTMIAAFNLVGLSYIIPINSLHRLLEAAACLSNVLFLVLVAATALTRLSPVRKAAGVEPRVSALLGSFLSFTLALLPKAELGPFWSITSTLLITVGAISSFIVLRWLGKSFSILAEARRLVTSGPYRLVRHPLYVCEGIALLGVALQVISPLAVVIILLIMLLQFRRMMNEEVVLSSAFPEYRDYAERTPRVIPVKLWAFN
jgi:protein-S-isoprenylcysteine O-methyltransferase Ste14